MRLSRRSLLLAGLGAMASSQLSWANTAYPNKAVNWVVGYPPGGGSDILTRNVGQHFGEALGQAIVVHNRPGAGGVISASYTAKAPADGYTLFTADNGILVYNPYLYKDLPYSPAEDFILAGMIAKVHMLLVSSPDSGFTSAEAAFEAIRKEPGKYAIATPGNGSPHHIALELFLAETGLDMMHVPYKGGAAALNDLMGNQIPFMLLDLPSGSSIVKAGKVHALASLSSNRPEQLPDTPTMAELGFPKVEAYAWMGLAVPKATPADVRARLHSVLQTALADPRVLANMKEAGQEATPGAADYWNNFIEEERVRWGALIKERGIRLD